MSDDFPPNIIELDCEACGKTFRATREQLLDPAFACPNCGDQEEVRAWREGLNDVSRMLGEMDNFRNN